MKLEIRPLLGLRIVYGQVLNFVYGGGVYATESREGYIYMGNCERAFWEWWSASAD